MDVLDTWTFGGELVLTALSSNNILKHLEITETNKRKHIISSQQSENVRIIVVEM